MKTISSIILSLLLTSYALGLPFTDNFDADHAEEIADKFEGDMILSNAQEKALSGSAYRNGLLDELYRWPNKTLYYRIVPDNFTSKQVAYIRKALDTIANVSCLRFEEAAENATSYVRVLGVGYMDSVQDLNLEPSELEKGCFRLGTIMHEFLHALGFYHMQSAVERDDFVKIVWANIRSGMEHNFKKYDANRITNFTVRYDYGSVMHYSDTAFSRNKNRTIVPLDEKAEIGQRKKLSSSDVEKLRKMYGCE